MGDPQRPPDRPIGDVAKDVVAQDAAKTDVGRPGKTRVAIGGSGGVKIPILGAGVICGLLTFGFISVAVTGGDTTPTPSVPPTQAPTPAPVVTTAAASTSAPRPTTLASPPPGSPVFVNFQNPLAEVVITGFGAPPPGTHLDHVSTFRVQATGTGLVYLWTLTNPVCGALVGAQTRTASVTWDHGKCGTLESAARISVTVVRAADLGPDGSPGAAAQYFTYSQTARAGDSFATDPLPKSETLQYFGPAAVPAPTAAPATAAVIASTATPVTPVTQSGSRLPWAPIAAAISAVACAALVWRSGVLSALRG